MFKPLFKTILRKIFLIDIRKSIPEEDIISRQRLNLFRIFTLTVTLALGAIAYQVAFVFHVTPLLAFTVYALLAIVILNYFLLNWHKNKTLAVAISVIAIFLALHYITYFSGGIRNSGMFYLSALILVCFMLLGSRQGKWFTALSIVHVIYFYFVTENTSWVNYDFIGYQDTLINQDYLFTGLISLFLVGSLINNLESNKNVVIASIIESKNKLVSINKELKKLSLVASKTDNAVAITDANGITEWVNDGFIKLTGYRQDEVTGKKMFELLTGALTDTLAIQNAKQILNNKQPASVELLKYKKDGNTTWIHDNITPIFDDKGILTKYIFIMSDINERKASEFQMDAYLKSLEKTNKELDQFAYVVSHDLKAPLRTIGNLSDWIMEDAALTLDPKSKENFNLIRGRVKRMELLINGILEYSKATKKFQIEEVFDFNEMVKDTAALVAPALNCKIIIGNNLPQHFGDKVKIQQVFLNLFSNAIKHNDKEQIEISLNCFEMDKFWKFSIKDNGPGIDPKFHDKIFIIFQTLKSRDDFEATGVGLAIVKKIIEEMGGKIWVESEIPDGATFNFIIPKQNIDQHTFPGKDAGHLQEA